MNKKTIETLISSGALDLFGLNHPTMKDNLDVAINYALLKGDLADDLVMKPNLVSLKDEALEEKRKEEYDTFGFYISNHPASKYIDPSIMKLENIAQNHNRYVTCVGILEYEKEIITKTHTKMAFLMISDETGRANFVVFASEVKSLENIKIGDLVLVKGRVARRYMEYQINVNQIEKIKEGV